VRLMKLKEGVECQGVRVLRVAGSLKQTPSSDNKVTRRKLERDVMVSHLALPGNIELSV
jgi:hypothetical protein